jgi:hypothetical protein
MVPIRARLAAEKLAARLGTSAATDAVFFSLCDENSDGEQVRRNVDQAQLCVLIGPPEAGSETRPVEALRLRLDAFGLTPEFIGHIRSDDQTPTGWSVAILRGRIPPRIGPAPPTFSVVAIMHAYNEADVIEQAITHLVHNGVSVYLVDNWSTDDTLNLARSFEGSGLVGFERFPPDGPATTFEWRRLLNRTEEIAIGLDADWIIHNDADEFRSSPWLGVSLRDALYHVQTEGYSAVDHGCLNFALTDDHLEPSSSVEQRLTWFEAARTVDLSQLNCWLHIPNIPVELAWSGGHTVRFPGQKVFPYNFLLRHYPIRSVEQGRRKVFAERLPRFRVEERLQGWHDHYDRVRAETLVRPTNGLVHFDSSFYEGFVLERLTDVGWEPGPVRLTFKLRMARALRRVGLLESVLRLRWKLTGRAAKR